MAFKVSNEIKQEQVKEIKKLGVDFGSKSIKICGEVKGETVLKQIKSKVKMNSRDTNYVVERDGKVLCFGVGEPLYRKDKTRRPHIEEQVLLAVHTIYGAQPVEIDLELAVGLPLDLFGAEEKKDAYEIELLEKFKAPLEGTVNGDFMRVKVSKLEICAEGYSGYVAICNKIKPTRPFVIFDMGYRTTDVLAITPDGDELNIDSYTTENKGMLEVLTDIQRAFLNDTKERFEVDTIENAILNNPKIRVSVDGVGTEVDVMEYVTAGEETLKPILYKLEASEIPDIFSRDIYFIGGGATLLNTISEHITKDENNNLVLYTKLISNQQDLTYCNCVGYFMQLED